MSLFKKPASTFRAASIRRCGPFAASAANRFSSSKPRAHTPPPRRPPLHRLRGLLGSDDPGPRASAGDRGGAIDVAADGLSFGAPTELETQLARRVDELMPSIELVRFVSSGTEATMSAIRLARGFTGRDTIVKFEGCYHGHSDSLLIKAGSGALDLRRAHLARRAEGARRALHRDAQLQRRRSGARGVPPDRRANRLRHRRAGGRQHELRCAGAGISRDAARANATAAARC
jgi:hypothetical protein